ncbi:MAG: hypothetical protein KBT09_05750, partial [Bacteroidales bacterium]|nr:hypothetical protein [Candidatus Sodaliphilus fimicaballi]
MGKSYNDVYNQLHIGLNDYTPSPSSIKAGDEFQLIRTINGQDSKVIRSINVKGIASNKWNCSVKNVQGKIIEEPSIPIQTTIIELLRKLTVRDNSEVTPGTQFDAQYQLKYIPVNNGTVLYSNVVDSYTMSTEVKTEALYRSGTPDPANNAAQELYTCRVKFKPLENNHIERYYIYKNASEVVASITQAEAMQNKDSEGFFSIRFDEPLTKKANKYENSSADFSQPVVFGDDLFFTVVVVDDRDNTYGNVDRDAQYTGSPAELVYNSTINAFTDHHGNFRAEINWNKIPSSQTVDADDYVLNDPDYYTVYRGIINENGDTVYSPITARYIGHDKDLYLPSGELDKGGFTKVDQTTDGSAYKFTKDLIKEIEETRIEGFKVFDFISLDNSNTPNSYPAMYYVKAHYD